ncbi:MAG: DUF2798 domain-containing protein [Phenylobacterium sp.]|uniref:DUF2798 domain-containing protein n=1 Tax=Phenylobacterium sp. TaxID=1871053 RepID=UPI00391A36F8
MPIQVRRLPARSAALVMPLILSVLMTFIVSAVSTFRSIGLSPHYPATWMGAWGMSWLVAYPALLLVLPLVRRIVGWLVEPA